MSVSHVSHDEPTRVDVWTVLKELPQRVQALLKHHEASQELGFEELEHELHALFTHAECAGDERGAGAPGCGPCPMCSSTGRSITGCTGARRPISARVGPVTAMRTLYRARPGERGGRCGGAQGRHRRRVLDAACGASGRDADRSPGAARGRGGVGCVGQHDALEELAGPTAQGALGAFGRRSAPSSRRGCARTRSRSRTRRAPWRSRSTG